MSDLYAKLSTATTAFAAKQEQDREPVRERIKEQLLEHAKNGKTSCTMELPSWALGWLRVQRVHVDCVRRAQGGGTSKSYSLRWDQPFVEDPPPRDRSHDRHPCDGTYSG